MRSEELVAFRQSPPPDEGREDTSRRFALGSIRRGIGHPRMQRRREQLDGALRLVVHESFDDREARRGILRRKLIRKR
jgi:hypothetical protein